MNGHTNPELFDPQDESEWASEQEQQEILDYLYWEARWSQRTIEGMPYHPRNEEDEGQFWNQGEIAAMGAP